MNEIKTTNIKPLRAVGTRVFNHGDQCNASHWGTISAIETYDGRFQPQYRITPDEGADCKKPYTIPTIMVGDVYKNSGSTRIVTEAAYNAWHVEATKQLEEMWARVRSAKAEVGE